MKCFQLYNQINPKPTSPKVSANAENLGLDPSAALPVLVPVLGWVDPFPSLPWAFPLLESPFPNSLKWNPDPFS